jgi:hypothetical protein
MPFSSIALVPLVQTPGFSLWHYRSTDTRDQVTGPGYFLPAIDRLRVGDVMIVQAADSLAILPVRSNAAIGTGVSLDGAVAPVALTRSVAQTFRIVQAASAVVSSIILAPLIAGILAGTSIPVSAQVTGPISQVVITVRNAQGQIIPPAQTVNVSQGFVNAVVPAPPVGSGYRIRVEDAADTGIVAVSSSFVILPDFQLLLTEAGLRIVQEDGFILAQN